VFARYADCDLMVLVVKSAVGRGVPPGMLAAVAYIPPEVQMPAPQSIHNI